MELQDLPNLKISKLALVPMEGVRVIEMLFPLNTSLNSPDTLRVDVPFSFPVFMAIWQFSQLPTTLKRILFLEQAKRNIVNMINKYFIVK
jgi:hypothetical protein